MGPLIFSRMAVPVPLAWEIEGLSFAKRTIDNVRMRKISVLKSHLMLTEVVVFIIHLQDE